MQRIMALCACALVLAAGLCPQAQAGVPLLIPHQGRLLDSDDVPVTGVIPITFRLFDSSEDGVAIWTEIHPAVVVTDGLFDVKLGSVTPLSLDMLAPASSGSGGVAVERYLEVEVNGTGLLPRLRLGTTPYAMASGRVSGDMETAPGELRLSGMSGSTTGTIRMMASPDSVVDVRDCDDDDDGFAESQVVLRIRPSDGLGAGAASVEASADRFAAGPRQSVSLDGTYSRASVRCATDFDVDGSPDVVVRSSTDADSAGIVLLHRGGPGHVTLRSGMSGSTTGTIRMMASHDSSGSVVGHDSDGDGRSESRFTVTARDQFGNCQLATDTDDDDVVDNDVNFTADSTGSRSALTHRGGSTTGTIRMMATEDSTMDVVDYDSDADGVLDRWILRYASPSGVHMRAATDVDDDGTADNSVESSCDATSSEHAIHTTGTGAQAGQLMSAGSRSSDDGVVKTFLWRQTEGPLGVMETEQEISMQADADSAALSVSNNTGGKGSVVVRSGMSGSTTGTIRMAADSGGVTDYLDLDDDGDGVAERYIMRAGIPLKTSDMMVADFDGDGHLDLTVSSQCDTTTASSRCASDVDDDGTEDYSVEASCDATQSSVVVKGDLTVGSGSLKFIVGNDAPEMSMEQGGTKRLLVRPDSGVQLYDDLGAKTCELGTDGTISVSGSLTIGAVASSHLIDVAGGAYCDGTDWVSVSDVASKENFEPVDGEELLDRIAGLEITRWNYKGRPGVEHIGPMAQDFQAAFGVGADDRTISSIDPSGIALAAIKELQKQNQDLKTQNERLQEALERLNRRVDALVSSR